MHLRASTLRSSQTKCAMPNLFDFDHPFFRPLWRRIAVVSICAGWGLFELAMGATGWAIVFLGLAALSFWGLFVRFQPGPDESDDPDQP